MSQGSQLWQNERMKAFFRAHVRRETALDEKAAEKLVEALTKAVNFMRVWHMPDETPAPAAAATEKGKLKATADAKSHDAKSHDAKSEVPFDPYAFSAMVVLTKTGREGLAKKITEIKGADNLRRFAEAQHLGIDRKLTKIDDLRKAILHAAEQRLADRRAAAS